LASAGERIVKKLLIGKIWLFPICSFQNGLIDDLDTKSFAVHGTYFLCKKTTTVNI